MSERKILKPNSYELPNGKWVPSGVISFSNDSSAIEYEETYKKAVKNTKKAADEYFVKANKEKRFKS